MDARSVALDVLCDCRRKDAWVDAQLNAALSRAGLSRRDAALAARLCYGVTQNRMLLDWYAAPLVTGGFAKLQPVVQEILRLALYQLVFLDKIPPSAAVNEAVRQAKRRANPRAAGLVNAVLRAFLRRPLPPPPDDPAIRYSHPPELVRLLAQTYGSRTEELLQSHNQIAPVTLQCNPLRSSAQALAQKLSDEGVQCTPHPWLEGCLLASGLGAPERLAAFRDGLFYIQDPAAQLAVRCAAPKPGDRVLDCCAAPGGKSVAAALLMQDRGEITSCDLHEKKLPRITKAAQRLGLTILTAVPCDARTFVPAWQSSMDLVLCDVPCSGLGVIRKKPDIRYKSLAKIGDLPPLQLEILENQARYVKPGGTLLYSTCTILPQENQAVIDAFVRRHPSFIPEPLRLPKPLCADAPGQITLLPDRDCADGFYLCKLRRSR